MRQRIGMTTGFGDGHDPFALGKQMWEGWSSLAKEFKFDPGSSWNPAASGFELPDTAKHALEAMGEQAQQLFGFLQQAGERMQGQGPMSVEDLTALWQQSMRGDNPMLDAMRVALGEGSRSFESMAKDMAGMAEPLLSQLTGGLRAPAFGLNREKQERLQRLSEISLRHAQANQAYNSLLAQAGQRGFEYFENKLADRSEPGRQIDSLRALYDLWIDAAEEAYAEVAMSPEFRRAYADMVNSQSVLRSAVQREVEDQVAGLGLPTRSELDGTHQKIKSLSTELRQLKQRLAALEAGNSGAKAEPASRAKRAVKPASAGKLGKPSNPSKSKSAKSAKAAKKEPAAKVAKSAVKAKRAKKLPTPSKKTKRG